MYKQLLKEIKLADKIIIHRHINPDGDALGSQFGFAEIIKDNFPNKKVICIGSKDEIKQESLKNIFEDNFDEVTDEDYKNGLVIVLDTANLERIKGQDFFKGNVVFKIDHHISNEKYATYEITDEKISSTSEIITSLSVKLKWKINKKAAEYLLAGIITDTGRFMFDSVKKETFEAARILVDSGAKTSKIANLLNDRNVNFTRIQGYILSNYRFKKGVSYFMAPKYFHKKYKIAYEIASSLVFLLMLASEVNYALYATYDSKSNLWKGSIRSRKKDISKIAEKYNGGGHRMAAGVKFKNKKEFSNILNDLLDLSKKNK